MQEFEKWVDSLSWDLFQKLHTAVNRRYDRDFLIHNPLIPLSEEEKQMVREGKRVNAVIALRTRVGCVLKLAHESVKAFEETSRIFP